MKKHIITFVAAILVLPGVGAAISDVPVPVDEDLYYASGSVQLLDLDGPSDVDALSGTVFGTIEGTGTLTIGDESGGGFPRLMLYGGTTIENQRIFEPGIARDWWTGILQTPKISRVPAKEKISAPSSFSSVNNDFTVLGAYSWGGMNEVTSFSPDAYVVLPVAVSDLTQVWLAYYSESSDSWSVDADDSCIVMDGFCDFSVSSVNAVALVRRVYSRCSNTRIANGYVGGVPDCRIKCDAGFTPNVDLTGCVRKNGEEDVWSALKMHSSGNNHTARPGYFRLTGTNHQTKMYDTEGLSGATKRRIIINNSAGAHRMSEPEPEVQQLDRAGFFNAVRELRAMLWEEKTTDGQNSNYYPAPPVEESVEEGEFSPTEEDPAAAAPETFGEETTTMHSSAPLLPSTGPAGIFVGLAVAGFGIMALSARKR
ncbi:hypothetical protein HN954_01230 [bacterium]|nr:hypothetical protein [bacterium]MBT6832297.1 hypothetical protein [bacterium]MBT6996034.1 hypothetical protein [bacterium]MBT7772313.1 hypothetical protein [bacterium]